MESLATLYKIGYGPSSSHTMGPAFAISSLNLKYHNANHYHVTLYNSLALTGIGHLTHDAMQKEADYRTITFDKKIDLQAHPNYMKISVYRHDQLLGEEGISSIGGGQIVFDGENKNRHMIYPHHSFKSIKKYAKVHQLSLPGYVDQYDVDAHEHLIRVWQQMQTSITQGLNKTGVLPGVLKVARKSQKIFEHEGFHHHVDKKLLTAYAFAVSEENASGNLIVTAPTCGACGILPSVLYYAKTHENISDEKIIEALKVAGIIGNLIKHNASISGAVAGCQAEIGSACCMAASAYAYLKNANMDQIEYAAEMAMEHHLGLTCDPINGYVQIPCIERNAHGALRAVDCGILSSIMVESRKISFDMVIETMYKTGLDIHHDYKETSTGGLAKFYKEDHDVNCW